MCVLEMNSSVVAIVKMTFLSDLEGSGACPQGSGLIILTASDNERGNSWHCSHAYLRLTSPIVAAFCFNVLKTPFIQGALFFTNGSHREWPLIDLTSYNRSRLRTIEYQINNLWWIYIVHIEGSRRHKKYLHKS